MCRWRETLKDDRRRIAEEVNDILRRRFLGAAVRPGTEGVMNALIAGYINELRYRMDPMYDSIGHRRLIAEVDQFGHGVLYWSPNID